MLSLPLQVTPAMMLGIILGGGVLILALNWWRSIQSVERAYQYFVGHAESASAS